MPRVLVIHRDTADAAARATRLRADGFDADPYTSPGSKGFRGIRAAPPDAIVIDLTQLPSYGKYMGALLRERLTVIPRSIDTEKFDPATVNAARIDALRAAWRVSPNDRIVLVPGRVAPWNGQMIVPDITRILVDAGVRDMVFVLAGEHHSYRKYSRFIAEQAKMPETAGLVGDIAPRPYHSWRDDGVLRAVRHG